MKEYRVAFYLDCASMEDGLNEKALYGFAPYIVTELERGYTVIFVRSTLDEPGYGV